MAYFSYFRAASFVPRIWLLELTFKFWQPLFCSPFKNGRAISYVVIHLLSRHFYRVDTLGRQMWPKNSYSKAYNQRFLTVRLMIKKLQGDMCDKI